MLKEPKKIPRIRADGTVWRCPECKREYYVTIIEAVKRGRKGSRLPEGIRRFYCQCGFSFMAEMVKREFRYTRKVIGMILEKKEKAERVCFTCGNRGREQGVYYCKLTGRDITDKEKDIECVNWEPKNDV